MDSTLGRWYPNTTVVNFVRTSRLHVKVGFKVLSVKILALAGIFLFLKGYMSCF